MRVYVAQYESSSYSWLTVGLTEEGARKNMERLALWHTKKRGLALWDWFEPGDVNVSAVSTDSGLMDYTEIDLITGQVTREENA